jgi:hypothetical protein
MRPLKLNLQASKRLSKIVMLIHGLALIASMLNSLPLFIRLLVFSAVAVHGYFAFKRSQIHSRLSIEHLETGWRVLEMEAEILPTTVISTLAIFLHFKTDNNTKQSLVIFNDALSRDDYRNLLVRLKITATKDNALDIFPK